jgi:hypothetical protein
MKSKSTAKECKVQGRLIEIQIPFAGFYESSHSYNLDNILEQDTEYLKDELGASEDEAQRYYDYGIDWTATQSNYVKAYADVYFDALADETELPEPCERVKLEMTSPREYNFATDRIFVKVPESWLIKLLRKTLKEKRAELDKIVKESFTSCDGFISYYPNTIEAWGNPRSWDHNQWSKVLETWLDDNGDTYLYERCGEKVCSLETTQAGKDLWNEIVKRHDEIEKAVKESIFKFQIPVSQLTR